MPEGRLSLPLGRLGLPEIVPQSIVGGVRLRQAGQQAFRPGHIPFVIEGDGIHQRGALPLGGGSEGKQQHDQPQDIMTNLHFFVQTYKISGFFSNFVKSSLKKPGH